MSNPLEQFEIKPLIALNLKGYDISFSNSAMAMCIAVVAIIVIFALCLKKRTIVPSLPQSIAESLYEFIYNLVKTNIGKEGLKYFPFVFCLFLYVVDSRNVLFTPLLQQSQ